MIDVANILLALYEADRGKFFDDPAEIAVFDPPLAGVAAADDPWFAQFKETMGDFYWTPQEALAQAAPGATARSVIAWVLPVAEIARQANRRQRQLPSRPWAFARTFGEEFLNRMRHGLEGRLRDLGYAALAPAVAPACRVEKRRTVGLAANWSERHTAFVAGLGTFGLSGGLITRRGIAHRAGSVVTDALIEPTPRPYGDNAFAWCLKLARGTCGACLQRCPVGSIGPTLAARNKDACYEHAYQTITQRGRKLFGWEGVYGCGLCQTGVPCEHRNPTDDK